MNTRLRNHVAALCLLATGSFITTALPTAAVAQSPAPEVRSLDVTSDNGIRTGSRLRLRMEASPNGQASVRIRGVQDPIALREVERGLYVGRYVISPRDRIEPGAPIRAILRQGNRTAMASYNVPDNLAGDVPGTAPPETSDHRPPAITALFPREGDRIPAGVPITISGQFEDRGGSGVDPARVRIVVSGNDMTRDARITPESFELRTTLPPGRHTVDVAARDASGNAARRSWSFDVAGGPAALPIEITSHPDQGTIEGNVAHLRGRTAPYATVQVRVQAVPPLVGQFGVAQQVFASTLQADANGEFAFSFTSPFPVPGTRYDVTLTATQADVTREAHMVLFQQRQG